MYSDMATVLFLTSVTFLLSAWIYTTVKLIPTYSIITKKQHKISSKSTQVCV